MTAGRAVSLVVPWLTAIVAIVIFFLVHPAQKFSFAPAMVLALVCYLRTSYQEMPDAARVLPLYLVALAILAEQRGDHAEPQD